MSSSQVHTLNATFKTSHEKALFSERQYSNVLVCFRYKSL
uniref:Uncharacterized protein n=1 Tax=Lepeophtheirus salmonis TaxID=72036 RepID=A0A0K2V4P0_LEPSM